MKRTLLIAALLAVTAIPALDTGAADVDPVPSEWSFGQNDPNPMCGATHIVFGVAQVAHVQFAIWNAGQTAVTRMLLD